MNNIFGLECFDDCAKYQTIIYKNHSDFILKVDWDDVDAEHTSLILQKILEILNTHWNDTSTIYPQISHETAQEIMQNLTFDGII